MAAHGWQANIRNRVSKTGGRRMAAQSKSGNAKSGNVYVACVPHTPTIMLQSGQRQASAEFWAAYDERVAEFDAFDPELVVVFGSDHYSNIHLNLTPSFMIGHAAVSINDCGGLPGPLDVPMDQTLALARDLLDEGFDVANSYAMK